MHISAILAIDSTLLIGSHNALPWDIPADMARFRMYTRGGVVVMGKNTYMSLPDAHRPLPNRRNIVLTRKPIAGIETYTSIDDMLDILGAEGVEHIWVMGGAAIYDEFFQRGIVDTVQLTVVDGVHTGDIHVAEFRDMYHVHTEEKFDGGVFQTLKKKK